MNGGSEEELEPSGENNWCHLLLEMQGLALKEHNKNMEEDDVNHGHFLELSNLRG